MGAPEASAPSIEEEALAPLSSLLRVRSGRDVVLSPVRTTELLETEDLTLLLDDDDDDDDDDLFFSVKLTLYSN